MFGRKTGFLAAMIVAVALFGGCGNGTAGNNLGGATGGDNGTMASDSGKSGSGNSGGSAQTDRTTGGGATGTPGYGAGAYSSGGTAYWDGYGINSGREMFADNTERNTYGMRTDNMMDDVRNAVDDLTNGRARTNSAVN